MDLQEKILIVDDKPANIFALEKLLERANRTFLSASNGNDGLKLALSNDIDLIILDVQMPEMDGFEMARILKSNKKTKDIPIIFASAEKRERQSIMKGFEEGAIDYLAKPLDPELTVAKVAVHLKVQMQKKELLEKNEQIRQLNLELQKNVSQLEIANKDLELFSYSVSHDLRAPLRLVNGFSKVLEEDYCNKLDDAGKKTLTVIQHNIDRMNGMIESLLEFSKLGKKELIKSEIDTDDLVRSIIGEMPHDSNNAGVSIKHLFPMNADLILIRQVWINLISNALKYSGKKQNPQIEIDSYETDTEYVYCVRDNGAGFNMEYAKKLFNVFQRLHRSEEFEGTGVGLAIVQRIVVRHGGSVWAEGVENEGAKFYFTLPRNDSKV